MFSKDITGSDAFREMPSSSQSLYFHLGMEADDDGFLDNYRGIMRSINASDDDLKILLSKRFLILFPSKVVVVKHWRINNTIRSDRYNETKHVEEKKALLIKENGSYTELNGMATIGIPSGTTVEDRIEEKRIEKIAPETVAFSFNESLDKLLNSEREDLRIIGVWMQERKFVASNAKQFQSMIRRFLRSAKTLIGYDPKDIRYTISALRNVDYLKKFTLETVAKYIDEMVEKSKKEGKKPTRWEFVNGAMRAIYE